MIEKVEAKQFLNLSETIPIIDVRSPAEFAKAHIPGAKNIPLFSNEERTEVGIVYKRQNKEKAILLGLEIVGTKLKYFAQKALKLSKNNKLLVHCWRGGMRSANMAWLFDTVGIDVILLEGGYKAFRTYAKQELAKPAKIKILSGSTGSGKTDILKQMKKLNAQVIDLEGLAHHKGSAFGAIGEKPQKETEMFENLLFWEFRKLDYNKTIWLEDESKAIGKNYIPDEIFLQMRAADVVKINIPKNIRIKRLVNEYTNADKDLLIYHINRISKRLGSNNAKLAIEAVKQENMYVAVDISLSFYDKAYDYGLTKREASNIIEINIDEDKPENTAKKLLVNRVC